jgi:hypothetical protein
MLMPWGKTSRPNWHCAQVMYGERTSIARPVVTQRIVMLRHCLNTIASLH